MGTADCGDLSVEPVDRVAAPFAAGDHVGVSAGCGKIEWEDLAGEGGEDFVGGLVQ
jgi:hypothetical protein